MLKTVCLRCWKFFIIASAIIIIAFAVFLNLARITVPMLDHERLFFEKWASQALHQPVKIGHVKGWWHGFEPQLQFSDVVVLKAGTNIPVVRVKKLGIGINIIQSLLQRRLLPGRLFISGAHLDIYQDKKNGFMVRGIVSSQIKNQSAKRTAQLKILLVWLLTETDIKIQNVDIDWRGQRGLSLPIRNLRLKINNNLAQHHIAGVATLAQTVPTQLKFNLNMVGSPLKKELFNASLYIRSKDFILSQWLKEPYLKKYLKGIRIRQGSANFQVWANWQHSQLQKVQAIIAAKHLDIRANHKATKLLSKSLVEKSFLLNHFSGNFEWLRYANGWGIKADKIDLRINGEKWPENKMGYRYYLPSSTSKAQHLLRFDYLRLQDIEKLAQEYGYWPEKIQAWYRNLKPHGELSHVALVYSPAISFAAHFKNVDIAQWKNYPGVRNLSGSIYYSPRKGVLNLDSHNAAITMPILFSRALHWRDLTGRALWMRNDNHISLRVSRYTLANKNIDFRGSLHLMWPQDREPRIRLLSEFSVNNVANLKTYLPKKLLNKTVSRWLRRAFVQGKVAKGTLLFNGPLASFPFDHHKGQFQVNMQLQNIALLFSSRWPLLRKINGSLTFDGRGMNVDIKNAQIKGNPLSQVKGTIKDLEHPVLELTGKAYSTLQQGLVFLHATPLKMNKKLSSLKLRGASRLDLALRILLSGKEPHVFSQGRVTVKNAMLALPHWGIILNRLTGVLQFKNGNLNAQNVTAQFAGQPITFDVATIMRDKKPRYLQIGIGGALNIDQLQKQYHLPLGNDFHGIMQFRAMLHLPSQASAVTSLSLASDLYGIYSTRFPKPYQKTAQQRRPFQLNIKIRKHQPLRMRMRYANLLSLALEFNNDKGHLNFIRGELSLGGERAHFQKKPGLLVAGKLNKVNWNQWRGFFSGKNAVESIGAPLRYVELYMKHLQISYRRFHHVYLKAFPKKAGWNLNVQSPNIAGILFIPKNVRKTWKGNFKHLYLSKATKKNYSSIDPKLLPPLDLTANDFRYGRKDFGQVHLITWPIHSGLKIKKLTMRTPLFGVSLIGQWQQVGSHDKTRIYGSFDGKDLGKLLTSWRITRLLSGGKGLANFALRWPGKPFQIQTKGLSGDVKANLKDGWVVHIGSGAEEKLGLGRLFNFLSLQSISRRLTLNFSDLGKKGFEFNQLKGDFVIKNGYAYLHSTSLNGPVAKIYVGGNVGFIKHDYNLNLFVSPHVTSSLPLIAGIAGGPIVGVAAWILSKIIGPEIGKAAGVSYKVTGSWKHPKIEKIKKLPQPRESEGRKT